jgi:hypothetical protein
VLNLFCLARAANLRRERKTIVRCIGRDRLVECLTAGPACDGYARSYYRKIDRVVENVPDNISVDLFSIMAISCLWALTATTSCYVTVT